MYALLITLFIANVYLGILVYLKSKDKTIGLLFLLEVLD